MLCCPRSDDIELNLDKSCVINTCIVDFSTLIWTLSGMWNAHNLGKKIPKHLILISLNNFYSLFCLHFCFLSEKIIKGKKSPLSLLEHIFMGRQMFGINTENACERGYDLFWCILHATYKETSSFTLKKKCCLIINTTFSLDWNEYSMIFWASIPCDPKTLTL